MAHPLHHHGHKHELPNAASSQSNASKYVPEARAGRPLAQPVFHQPHGQDSGGSEPKPAPASDKYPAQGTLEEKVNAIHEKAFRHIQAFRDLREKEIQARFPNEKDSDIAQQELQGWHKFQSKRVNTWKEDMLRDGLQINKPAERNLKTLWHNLDFRDPHDMSWVSLHPHFVSCHGCCAAMLTDLGPTRPSSQHGPLEGVLYRR